MRRPRERDGSVNTARSGSRGRGNNRPGSAAKDGGSSHAHARSHQHPSVQGLVSLLLCGSPPGLLALRPRVRFSLAKVDAEGPSQSLQFAEIVSCALAGDELALCSVDTARATPDSTLLLSLVAMRPEGERHLGKGELRTHAGDTGDAEFTLISWAIPAHLVYRPSVFNALSFPANAFPPSAPTGHKDPVPFVQVEPTSRDKAALALVMPREELASLRL